MPDVTVPDFDAIEAVFKDPGYSPGDVAALVRCGTELIVYASAARDMLAKHQWSARMDFGDEPGDQCCPECRANAVYGGSHGADCRLAALIGAPVSTP